MKVKRDKADEVFSLFIRLRDGKCVKCGRLGDERTVDGHLVKGLQCSHYHSRRKETTRFDPDNCDALCFPCHHYWGGDGREDYRDFKVQQLGQKKFDMLKFRSNCTGKKNRQLSYMIAKQWLENLLKEKGLD